MSIILFNYIILLRQILFYCDKYYFIATNIVLLPRKPLKTLTKSFPQVTILI